MLQICSSTTGMLPAGVVLKGHLLVELVHMLPYPPMFKGVRNLAEVQLASTCTRTASNAEICVFCKVAVASEIATWGFSIRNHGEFMWLTCFDLNSAILCWSVCILVSLLYKSFHNMIWPRLLLWGKLLSQMPQLFCGFRGG